MSNNCSPVGGNLGCATSTGGANPACIGGLNTFPDAYFEFVSTGPDAYINLTSANPNLGFVLYAGTSCVTTPEFFCSAVITSGVPTLVTGLTTGATYTLRVLQPIANAGTFTLCVQKLDVSDDPCTAVAINCGDLRFGRTVGRLNNIPAGACPYNGLASTGGVNYFSYTAPADGDVRFTTCGQTNFDSRISVFDGACTSLSCNVMNDNSAGCPGGSSEAEVRAVNGQTYIIMVHGAGALEGTYQLSVTCPGSFCSPSEANDRCPNSVNIPVSVIGDGTLPSTQQQACSYADAPTGCSGPDMVQGVWFDFATTSNTLYDVYIAANNTDPQYTAQNMNMALYSGACNVGGASGASGEVFCFTNCQGTLTLPALTPNSTYRLLVYNTGNTAEGTFGLRMSRPGFNDAGIAQVDAPVGNICDGIIFPQVWLKNYGESPLTSAQIISRIDGSIVQTEAWSGSPIARGDSILVVLDPINSPLGPHSYSAETALPNGAGDELASNDSKLTSYDATGQTVKVRVRADNNPNQISWTIFDAFFFPVGQSVPGQYTAGEVGTTSVCLPTTLGNCFYFFMFDAGGDGICCLSGNGDWELRDVLDRRVLRDNGEYLGQSPALSPATNGYFAHEFCLPLGPTAPLVTECGIFNNLMNNKVYCNAVAGVVNYQFEFSNPDAGFRRRIGLPRTYVKFSEMVSNPLTFGVTYFCRVRADQGAAGYLDDFFGNGCEMALAPVQPICTELISTPGPTFSCGATKAFGGSSKIWAQPVVGATQYRFNFSNVGEGYNRNVLVSSYVLLLSWVTQPLVNGSTYQVKVECFVSGVWSGFCGATCQLTIVNPPAFNNTHSRASETLVDENSGVQMWPNPVGDGRVNVQVSDLNEEIEHVTIDVYDVFGKRVMSETPVVSGETFNYVLNLDKSMAAGVYTVNITINDHAYTQRLSVQ
ncbi:MAG: T9SS type A sorting domain-containing protein [Flavobacteriales bacterium]|nr:T9SS type A sorting domain-containing protein [Flavobacteriales bacterium]